MDFDGHGEFVAEMVPVVDSDQSVFIEYRARVLDIYQSLQCQSIARVRDLALKINMFVPFRDP